MNPIVRMSIRGGVTGVVVNMVSAAPFWQQVLAIAAITFAFVFTESEGH